jgi:hypothetical protein
MPLIFRHALLSPFHISPLPPAAFSFRW